MADADGDGLVSKQELQESRRRVGRGVAPANRPGPTRPNIGQPDPTQQPSTQAGSAGAIVADAVLPYPSATNVKLTNQESSGSREIAFAWGSNKIVATDSQDGIDGRGRETALPLDANTHFARTISGPLRAGIHMDKATREMRGESYYGAHDLSGNVVEMAVNLSSAAGRRFAGEHGDGAIDADGRASDVASWPRIPANPPPAFNTEFGFGYRGGDFWNPELDLRVSSRNVARFSGTRRLFGLGFRGVRTASESSKMPIESGITKLHGGFRFIEGPTADPDGNVYFTDPQASVIYKIDLNGMLTTLL